MLRHFFYVRHTQFYVCCRFDLILLIAGEGLVMLSIFLLGLQVLQFEPPRQAFPWPHSFLASSSGLAAVAALLVAMTISLEPSRALEGRRR